MSEPSALPDLDWTDLPVARAGGRSTSPTALRLVGAGDRAGTPRVRVLVIRCCRMPQLTRALALARAAHPDADVHVLTSPDFVDAVAALAVDRVIAWPYRRIQARFRQWRAILALRRERFDVVVVPYMGADGSGYANVHRVATLIAASSYMMVPAVDEPLRFNRAAFRVYAAGTLGRFLRHHLDLPLMLASLALAVIWPRRRMSAAGQPPRRVLHVITSLGAGGAQVQMAELVAHSRARGLEPEVLVLNRSDGDFSRRHLPGDVPVHYLQSWPFLFSSVREIRDVCGRGRFDVVHTWLFYANVLGAAGARLAGAGRIVSSVRNLSLWKRTWYRQWWYRLADVLTARAADVVTVNASALVQDHADWALVSPDRITVVSNGLAADAVAEGTGGARAALLAECGFPPDALVLGAVGRLAPEKDHQTFLDVVARIRVRRPEVRAVIVGDGELRVALEQTCARLGLTGEVRFLGARHDSRRLIAGFDAFLLSSVIEGFPNVLLEAVLLGVPAVATDVGGASDLLPRADQRFPAGDAARATTLVLAQLDDPSAARAHAAELQARARALFSVERMSERWHALYGDADAGRALEGVVP